MGALTTYASCLFRAMIRKILTHTNVVVMIDDPIITPGMEEFLLQTESGLSAGSITAGLVAPQGSLLLTSNNDVFNR